MNITIQLNPLNPFSYLSLGWIADKLGDYERAIENYEKGMKIDPQNILGINGIAISYRKKKNYELAFQNAYKAIELDSQNGYSYSTLAEIYSDKGNENEFYKNFELALIFNYDIEVIYSEVIYQPYFKQEKFIKLLEKYGKKINN